MTPLLEQLRAKAKAATLIMPVPGMAGYYADAFGNIWSANSRWMAWRMLKPSKDTHGYLKLKIKRDGRLRKTACHKMVTLAYHGEKPTPQHEIRHLDGSRTNNLPGNLCWGTKSENARDRKTHGTERAPENGAKSWRKCQATKMRLYGHR